MTVAYVIIFVFITGRHHRPDLGPGAASVPHHGHDKRQQPRLRSYPVQLMTVRVRDQRSSISAQRSASTRTYHWHRLPSVLVEKKCKSDRAPLAVGSKELDSGKGANQTAVMHKTKSRRRLTHSRVCVSYPLPQILRGLTAVVLRVRHVNSQMLQPTTSHS